MSIIYSRKNLFRERAYSILIAKYCVYAVQNKKRKQKNGKNEILKRIDWSHKYKIIPVNLSYFLIEIHLLFELQAQIFSFFFNVKFRKMNKKSSASKNMVLIHMRDE